MNDLPKVLLIADWNGVAYAEAFYNSFQEMGCEVKRFSWKEYFHHYQYSDRYQTDNNRAKSIYYRAQNKLLLGPALKKINRDIVSTATSYKPDLVFIYRGTHVFPKTIERLKNMGALVFGYNNDDPFSINANWLLWRHYLSCVKHYDHIFCYRRKNISDYKSLGANNTSLLRSYYIPENNYPLDVVPNNKYACDVVFIGHFENDGRDDDIKSLLDNGIDVKVFGPEWNKSKYFEYFCSKMGEVQPVYADYNLALNSAKIALVFLSKLNNDTYTRRCFEIPSTKTLMLSERTNDLEENLFLPDIEAVYFSSANELKDKIKVYLRDERKRLSIAQNGYLRLKKDGHTSYHRVREVLMVWNKLRTRENDN